MKFQMKIPVPVPERSAKSGLEARGVPGSSLDKIMLQRLDMSKIRILLWGQNCFTG